RQLGEQTRALEKCQEERDRSQARIVARQLAEAKFSTARSEQQAALNEQRQRTDAVGRLQEVQETLGPAKTTVETLEQSVTSKGGKQVQAKKDVRERRDNRKGLQQRANRVAAKLRALDDTHQLSIAQEELQKVQDIVQAIAAIKEYLADNPVPDKP